MQHGSICRIFVSDQDIFKKRRKQKRNDEISGILLILKFYFPYLIAISRDIKINQSSKDALPYQQLTATKIG